MNIAKLEWLLVRPEYGCTYTDNRVDMVEAEEKVGADNFMT